jgi:hypothetical protein
MSDPTALQTQPQTPDIGQQIVGAPEKVWKRLRDTLKVKTREQAVALVAQDETAAEAARTILATTTEDILTRKSQKLPSLLTRGQQTRSPAETLYGGSGGLSI